MLGYLESRRPSTSRSQTSKDNMANITSKWKTITIVGYNGSVSLDSQWASMAEVSR